MVMSAAEKRRRAAARAVAAASGKEEPTSQVAAETAAPATSVPKVKAPSLPLSKEIEDSLGAKIRKPEEITAPSVHAKPATVGDRTVSVVCKMPRGIYLQLHEFVMQDVRVMGGGVEKRQMPMRVGEPVRLRPAKLPFGALPNYPIVEGFSITNDVDANFWNSYYQQNKQLELITSGMIAAFKDEVEARAYCLEYGKLRTGLEPIDPAGDERVDKEQNPNLTDIQIDTDAPSRTKAAR